MTHTITAGRRKSRRRLRRERIRRWSLAAVAGVALATLAIGAARLVPPVVGLASTAPVREAIATELTRTHAPPDVVAFYAAREDRPLWVETSGLWPAWRLRPEAAQAEAIALGPAPGPVTGTDRPTLDRLIAASANGRPADLARAEVALSLALADHVLRRPAKGAELAFVDPDLRAPATPGAVLARTASAPSLAEGLTALDAVNPIYAALREDLARYRSEWSRLPQVQVPAGPALGQGASGERVRLLRVRLGLADGGQADHPFDTPLAAAVRHFQAAHGLPPTGEADAATLAALNAGARYYERLIEANLERARALPPITARRFILVNVAARKLWLYENGQPKDSMKVIVGEPREQTPMMAGLIRYLVVNPYWNVPVDLVRDRLAPKVLQFGPSYLQSENMQVLSDWGDDAAEVDPATVDWAAVAAGKTELRVRQRPGGDNMMGAVKFMLPNELGIYLHDTPEKDAFLQPDRLLSAGCVRVERATEIKSWLLGRDSIDATWVAPEQRVDLDAATPVYITYLTAAPGGGGPAFFPDVYSRDPALLAAMP